MKEPFNRHVEKWEEIVSALLQDQPGSPSAGDLPLEDLSRWNIRFGPLEWKRGVRQRAHISGKDLRNKKIHINSDES